MQVKHVHFTKAYLRRKILARRNKMCILSRRGGVLLPARKLTKIFAQGEVPARTLSYTT